MTKLSKADRKRLIEAINILYSLKEPMTAEQHGELEFKLEQIFLNNQKPRWWHI